MTDLKIADPRRTLPMAGDVRVTVVEVAAAVAPPQPLRVPASGTANPFVREVRVQAAFMRNFETLVAQARQRQDYLRVALLQATQRRAAADPDGPGL